MAASDKGIRTLLENAYAICLALRDYSKENLHVLENGDDDAIQYSIQEREKYISALSEIESEIDAIIDDGSDRALGAMLEPEDEKLRRSIRTLLDEVETLDIGAMTLVSKKMHEYRMETMKARNRKHLSSYFQEEIAESNGGFDFMK